MSWGSSSTPVRPPASAVDDPSQTPTAHLQVRDRRPRRTRTATAVAPTTSTAAVTARALRCPAVTKPDGPPCPGPSTTHTDWQLATTVAATAPRDASATRNGRVLSGLGHGTESRPARGHVRREGHPRTVACAMTPHPRRPGREPRRAYRRRRASVSRRGRPAPRAHHQQGRAVAGLGEELLGDLAPAHRLAEGHVGVCANGARHALGQVATDVLVGLPARPRGDRHGGERRAGPLGNVGAERDRALRLGGAVNADDHSRPPRRCPAPSAPGPPRRGRRRGPIARATVRPTPASATPPDGRAPRTSRRACAAVATRAGPTTPSTTARRTGRSGATACAACRACSSSP